MYTAPSTPRNARDGRAALFTGAASTFKEKNNTTVIGAGVKSPRHWIDEDTYYEDYESNGETLREKWVRHDLPQDFQKILADIGY